MKNITTILSRVTRAKAKLLSIDELTQELDLCTKLAIQWMTIPDGLRQASKFWDGVTFYERLIEKKKKK